MNTIVITGGASGIGKELALSYLKKGDRVIAIGSSTLNGDQFLKEASALHASERAIFIQGDLSLASENIRIVYDIKTQYPMIDKLILCASRHHQTYTETVEGFEASFALDYLSRFIFSYGLKEALENSDSPVIMNICGTGMDGEVSWNDLQHKNSFIPMKVMMHGSRLNDLLAVAFTQNDKVGKIKYILYNPMAVNTPGMLKTMTTAMKLTYKFIGKPIEKSVIPMITLLDTPPTNQLSAFKERKTIALSKQTYNKTNAKKLYELTMKMI